MIQKWTEIDENSARFKHPMNHLNTFNNAGTSVQEEAGGNAIPLTSLLWLVVDRKEISSCHGEFGQRAAIICTGKDFARIYIRNRHKSNMVLEAVNISGFK